MTYTALCCLAILGDDLSRVNRAAIIGSLRFLQNEAGGFSSTFSGGETDLRFVYCACVISKMLNDWSGFDLARSERFVASCQSFDGGFALRPGCEGHGGSTYCGVASLQLMGRLEAVRDAAELAKWCVQAQGAGFVGRPNKPPDSCYSFWIGATMKMLGIYDYSNRNGNRAFNFECQTKYGGFGKHPNTHPDILHSYFGLCGLSLIGFDGLATLDPALGITERARAQAFPHCLPAN